MKKIDTEIENAFLLKPKIHGDERGFFLESWNESTFKDIGLDLKFIQDNHSRSTKNVLRGLHFQIGDAAQGKLVWVMFGAVFDVIVDLRKSSNTFGRWASFLLTSENHDRLWVPPGCAHGFLVLSEVVDFYYKVTTPYQPAFDRTLLWNDPELNINWPMTDQQPLVSAKDSGGLLFKFCEKYS
jgi:dTDP-4-dehydrorhamnose 3,5-epimerase